MSWFLRSKKNISDDSELEIRETPDGLWTKCPSCSEVIYKKQFEENLHTCPKCSHHFRIGFKEYSEILFDEGSFVETNIGVRSADPLEFVDTRPYEQRIEEAYKRTGLNDALSTGYGTIDGNLASLGCMNFGFVAGSMGSVVGEKFVRAGKYALDNSCPFIVISTSGGARMQEAALSLMQMAKTSVILAELDEASLPFISILTDPTTGGVSASFAMLGDINIAEPKALIGFAGPRVIEQTIRRKLPSGFQSAEFLLEHGFVDIISHRRNLKSTLSTILQQFAVGRYDTK
jgi:acetyl-CoA carboxylase carboxyl transferase subunit beta